MFSIQDFVRKPSSHEKVGLKILTEKEIHQIQQVLFDMYQDILFVCNKYGLSVLLVGGSALGAVRHGGFIPWDDDIDLVMPRKDYNMFIEVFPKEFASKYDLASPTNTINNIDYMVRVIKKGTIKKGIFDLSKLYNSGILIDISALDYVPENRLKKCFIGILSNILCFIINSKAIFICQTNLSKKYFSLNIFSKLFYYIRISIGAIFSFYSYYRLCHYYDRLISLCDNSTLLSIPSGRKHYFGEIFSYNVFYPFKEILFNGVISFIPNDYDTYLRNLYGDDYMIVPSKDKIEPHTCKELKIS